MLCFSPRYVSKTKNILVCYHSNCVDGFASAVIAFTKFGKKADYLSVSYNTEYDLEIFKNKIVYIVDFSFSRIMCENINKIAKSLTILDHHKTAQEELLGLEYAKFDMEKSGALMTWEFFYPDSPPPLSIQYISNYDLWNHYNPEVLWFNKAIRSLDFNLYKWSSLFKRLEDGDILEVFLNKGKIIEKFTSQQIEIISSLGVECIINGKTGLIVNCSSAFTSEVGSKLAEKSGTYGACFVITGNGMVKISLRSIGDYDVSDIAKELNGGGHKNSAGCSVFLSEFKFINDKFIINK